MDILATTSLSCIKARSKVIIEEAYSSPRLETFDITAAGFVKWACIIKTNKASVDLIGANCLHGVRWLVQNLPVTAHLSASLPCYKATSG